MTTLLITIDDDYVSNDDSIDEDQLGGQLASLPERAPSPDETVAPDVVQDALDMLPGAAVAIYRTSRHPEWEPGEPCPECGHETMSVMAAEEDLYDSRNGEFRYVKKGEAIGPHLSILCPACMTSLRHAPYDKLAV